MRPPPSVQPIDGTLPAIGSEAPFRPALLSHVPIAGPTSPVPVVTVTLTLLLPCPSMWTDWAPYGGPHPLSAKQRMS